MNRVPPRSLFTRWMLRPVLLLLALAQLVVVAAPAFDRAGDRDSGTHLETAGTRLHYVHDDAACPACQAQHLIGRIVPATHLVVVEVLRAERQPSASTIPPSRRVHHPAAPRAPPGNQVV